MLCYGGIKQGEARRGGAGRGGVGRGIYMGWVEGKVALMGI